MRAALYLRQSMDRTGDGLAVERQRADCRALAERRGWTVVDEYVDNDTSASVGVRPAFERLLLAMQCGDIEAVIVWHIDRLLRKMTDLERVIEVVEQTGCRLATVSGEIDLSTDMGRMVGRIMASVARAEVERKSARHKRANRQKAEAGKPHGARRAFGYAADGVTQLPEEVAVLRRMGEMVLSGESFKDVAYWLNREGFKTAQGKLFYPITVRNTLTRKRYAGVREYDGVEYPAIWQPVWNKTEWEHLQHVIRMRREAAGERPAARKYLLTGFLYCGKCGQPLNGQTKRDRKDKPLRRTYACRVQGDTEKAGGCGGVVRGAEPLEDFIKDVVSYRLDSPAFAALIDGDSPELGELLENRARHVAKLTQLVDDYADGTLNKQQFARANGRVQSKLDEVEAEIDKARAAALKLPDTAGQSFKEAWESPGDGWKAEVLSLMIDRITVKPGNTKPFYYANGRRHRFDPELIEVAWRV